MRKLSVLLLTLLLFASSSNGQSECNTDERHQQLLGENEAYREAYRLVQDHLPSSEADTGQIFTVPVVVHVIHLGEQEGMGSNISQGQVVGAINKMNNNFRAANGLNINMQFCLAQVDPEGNPTNGIIRVDGRSVPYYQAQGLESSDGPGADETAVKDLSRWPNTEYYNIWVVHKIAGGVTGYAYYPTTYINDGTSIEAWAMSNLVNVLTHEVGHGFDLYHTFQGDWDGSVCPSNTNCQLQGDQICDTPPHRRGDCFFGNPCTVDDSQFANSWKNFMSYCGITSRFTPDQKVRMRQAALNYPRNLLVASNTCQPLTALDLELTSIDEPGTDTLFSCGSMMNATFTATNLGTETVQQFAVTYTIDNSPSTAYFNTNLTFGQSAQFSLPEAGPLTDGPHTISLVINSLNESADENPLNDSLGISFVLEDTCTVSGIFSDLTSTAVIFPNPLSGNYLNVMLKSGSISAWNWQIFDAIGRELDGGSLQPGNNGIDITGYSRGAYFLVILNGGSQATFKLIRQ